MYVPVFGILFIEVSHFRIHVDMHYTVCKLPVNPPPWPGLSSVGSNKGTVLFLFLTPSTGEADRWPLSWGFTGAWPPTVTSGLSANWRSPPNTYYNVLDVLLHIHEYECHCSGKYVQAEQLGIHSIQEGQLACLPGLLYRIVLQSHL